MKTLARLSFLLVIAPFVQGTCAAGSIELTASPAEVVLSGRDARQQIVVTATTGGQQIDVTRDVKFRSDTPGVFSIDSAGILTGIGDGEGTVTVKHQGKTISAPVRVSDSHKPREVDFELDILPVLTRAGCNAGACHGKARGQNGFQLSLLGFDPEFDYDALTSEARGRRVFLARPDQSLLLRKPIGDVPHGGGRKLQPDGYGHRLLRRWIVSGMPRRQSDGLTLERISVFPSSRIMSHDAGQQVLVTAHYSDDSSRDVTHLSAFQSNEGAIAEVDENGLIQTSHITGEAAIMARYMGHIAVCEVSVPLEEKWAADRFAKLPTQNYIDEHVWKKLQRLGIQPSSPAADHKFLRRASIDIIGRIPTTEEAREFLGDDSLDKREKLIDRLLEQPEFAEHWANKWADLLRPNPYRVGMKAVLNYDAWIRDSFRQNKPYDQFVKELLTAQGSTFQEGAVTLFRDRRSPDELTTIVSQLFLGIRLECAKCHHHPFEVWGQDDFYSFAAYFARIGRKGKGLSPPISGSEEIIYTSDSGSVRHPLTGDVLPPRPLFGDAPKLAEDHDPRIALANWMTSPENTYFVQVQANRVWADLMGRGLVEPVDDLRATNPPSNGPLLTALGEDFRYSRYDLKSLIRRIANSYVYGLSSTTNKYNEADTRNYSRRYRQRMRAEVLLDSVCQVTGVRESFDAMPPGSSAKEIWTHRVESLFLDAFGRPDPNQDPPCERTSESTVVQTLHLMNSENLYRKVANDLGLAALLASSERSSRDIIEELYLATYSRFPQDKEYEIASALFEESPSSRRQATEDLLWALLNTPEFIFKD